MFHLVIIALVVCAAGYASFMPNRASSRASSLINPADGLSYSGVIESGNLSADQALKSTTPGGTGQGGPVVSAGLAQRNSTEVLSAGLAAPTQAQVLAPVPSSLGCDTSQSDKYCVYTVQPGDTLSSIADAAGLTSTEDVANWELLVHSNKPDIVSEDDLLQIGQKLRIPRGNGAIHTVLSSETLSDIAEQFDVPIDDIINENGINDANALGIGTELLIPSPKRFATPIILADPDTGGGGGGGGGIVGGGARSDFGFIWPISGPISSYFGPGHPLGIDIDLFGNGGVPIAAAKAGTVSFAGGNPCCSYGYYVVIDHGDGYQTLYAHLSAITVSVGERVVQGEMIGRGGSTGYSTGTHLHFEVHRNGAIVNPLSYLP